MSTLFLKTLMQRHGPRPRPRPAIGLDIGTAAVKAVAIDTRRQPPVLQGQAIVPLAETQTPPEAIRAAVRRVARRPGPIGTAIRANEAITRRVQVPQGLSDKALAAQVSMAAETELHQPWHALHHDFRVIGPSQDATPASRRLLDVMLVAARRPVVEARLQALHAAGLQCALVDIEPHALARTLALAGAGQDLARAHAIIDAGAGALRLHVIAAGEPIHGQDHPLATDTSLDGLIERALAVYQGLPDARPLDHLWLTGGQWTPARAERLAQRLPGGASMLDPGSRLTAGTDAAAHTIASHLPRLATAIGLALHAGDADAHWR